jgi:hypothetical protein
MTPQRSTLRMRCQFSCGGVVKKKLKLNLTSEKTSSGRVYRIVEAKPLVSSRKAPPEVEQAHA